MQLSRRMTDNAKEVETTMIFEGIKIKGEIKGEHNLMLNGELDGKVELTALMIVGKTGSFSGEIKAQNVIIEGKVDGKLIAEQKVEIRDSGSYKGDVVSPSIMISDKAFFQGNVKMVRDGEKPAVQHFKEKRGKEEQQEKQDQQQNE